MRGWRGRPVPFADGSAPLDPALRRALEARRAEHGRANAERGDAAIRGAERDGAAAGDAARDGAACRAGRARRRGGAGRGRRERQARLAPPARLLRRAAPRIAMLAMDAAMIETARTPAAKPTLNRNIVLNSHVAATCNARAVDWFLCRRIVAPICDEFAWRVRSPGVHRRGSAARLKETMQVLVVGAGVVGLAVARAAARKGHEVIVAEATKGIGNGVSSRNSEVIHGGMYYPTGSLRAYHCPRGRRLMYEFCASHGVPHRKCGKLIVATEDAEVAKMEAILKQGEANGVEGFRLIDGAAARAMEPQLNCVAALHSPETGIVDSHSFMRALQGDLEDRGGAIAFDTKVERLIHTQAGWVVRFSGSESGELAVDAVVNSAGLGAQALGAAHRGLSGGARAAARARARQLLRLRRAAGVLAADLSGAAHRRRARHPCDARSRRPHAVRSRRRVDRGGELQRQSGAREVVLRQHPALLAGAARQFIAARLCRRPAEADRGRASPPPIS